MGGKINHVLKEIIAKKVKGRDNNVSYFVLQVSKQWQYAMDFLTKKAKTSVSDRIKETTFRSRHSKTVSKSVCDYFQECSRLFLSMCNALSCFVKPKRRERKNWTGTKKLGLTKQLNTFKAVCVIS
jgi:hypothetical protein